MVNRYFLPTISARSSSLPDPRRSKTHREGHPSCTSSPVCPTSFPSAVMRRPPFLTLHGSLDDVCPRWSRIRTATYRETCAVDLLAPPGAPQSCTGMLRSRRTFRDSTDANALGRCGRPVTNCPRNAHAGRSAPNAKRGPPHPAASSSVGRQSIRRVGRTKFPTRIQADRL